MSSTSTRVGVCSWSLQPKSPAHLVQLVRGVGVDSVQLALDPIRLKKWKLEETRDALAAAGVAIRSGMMAMEGEDYSTLASIRATGGIAPDWTWETNLQAARKNATIARDLGTRLVTFHAGHIPDAKQAAKRRTFVDRVHRLARVFGEQGVRVALETGQETWHSVLELLGELDRLNRAMGLDLRIGVNFDPANMILYGMGDPVEALQELLPRVVQAHVKDAKASLKKGMWGTEVPAGDGDVLWRGFFELIDLAEPPIDLMIEREGGTSRVEDARAARWMIERMWEGRSVPGDSIAPTGPRPAPGRTLTIGVAGLGFMGRTHVAAYQALAARQLQRVASDEQGVVVPRVVAACDERAEARTAGAAIQGNIDAAASMDIGDAFMYESARELFQDPSIDAVSICTPTHTHKKLVWDALAAGKHVLVEKPVALLPSDVRELADAAVGAERIVMPAMCMRFWPGWTWLKEAIDSKRYGKLTSLVLTRLGTTPTWSGVYADDSKTGGAMMDLHVHDADLVLWMLGAPSAVASVGTQSHIATQYYFDKRPELLVTAEGSWKHSSGWNYRMRYCATFEKATAEWDSTRDPTLVLYRDGTREAIPILPGTGYDGEIEHFVDLVAASMDGQKGRPAVTMRDAERVAELLWCEKASQEARRIAEFAERQPQRRRGTGKKKRAEKAKKRAR